MIIKSTNTLRISTFLLVVLFTISFIYAAENYNSETYGSGSYGQAVCGDSVCDSSETCSTCSSDCGVCVDDLSSGIPIPPGEGTPILLKSHLLVQINPGEGTSITSFEDTGVKEIIIEVNQEVNNVIIKISKYNSRPIDVSVNVSGKNYRYLEINAENLDSNLEKVTMKFEVEKSWVSNNSLEKENIVVLKFDKQVEEWNELETIFDSEDENFYIYKVELDSFSFFAIGEKVKEVIEEVGEVPIIEKRNLTGMFILIALIGVVILIIVGYFIKKMKFL